MEAGDSPSFSEEEAHRLFLLFLCVLLPLRVVCAGFAGIGDCVFAVRTERERERERQTERQRETERERERQRESERERQTYRQTYRERERARERHTEREKERETYMYM